MRTLKDRSSPFKGRWRWPGGGLRFVGVGSTAVGGRVESVSFGCGASGGRSSESVSVLAVDLRARLRGCVVALVAPVLVAGAAPAVAEASDKNSADDKLGELELGGGGVVAVCVHDDLRAVPVEQVLERIECEPTVPVFVGSMHWS